MMLELVFVDWAEGPCWATEDNISTAEEYVGTSGRASASMASSKFFIARSLIIAEGAGLRLSEFLDC